MKCKNRKDHAYISRFVLHAAEDTSEHCSIFHEIGP